MLNKNNRNKLLGLILLLGFALFSFLAAPFEHSSTQAPSQTNQVSTQSSITQVYKRKQSDVQVHGFGEVVRILKDDTKGHKHQKFLLRLASGETILIAHNIDLAPRIENLSIGESVAFYGEYEYNPKGGVVHWTHHDPQKRHINGWLKHKNRLYR